jgi:hypothetical protein
MSILTIIYKLRLTPFRKEYINDYKRDMNKNEETLIEIIMRQTNYSKEVAAEKLVQHKHNILSIVREYMRSDTNMHRDTNMSCENSTSNKNEPVKSTSQLIYGEIRNMMGNAAANYRRKKEFEEYKQAQQQAYLMALQAKHTEGAQAKQHTEGAEVKQ